MPACRQGADGRIVARASAGNGASPASGPRWRPRSDTNGRGARQGRRTDTRRRARRRKGLSRHRRRATLRRRQWLRAERAAMRGRDRYPARGRDAAAAFRPAARSRSRRDRARPPEDEPVRGRTRPALTPPQSEPAQMQFLFREAVFLSCLAWPDQASGADLPTMPTAPFAGEVGRVPGRSRNLSLTWRQDE